MPTGYTEKLMTKGQTFQEYAMLCARNFGACVMRREDPMSAPIPEMFEPREYYVEELRKTKEKLVHLQSLSPTDADRHGQKNKDESVGFYEAMLAREIAENQRLDEMTVQVEKWKPPTPDHQGMKEFMLEQIKVSRHDTTWVREELKAQRLKPATEFFAQELTAARREIVRYAKEQADEVARANSRTAWIQALRKS